VPRLHRLAGASVLAASLALSCGTARAASLIPLFDDQPIDRVQQLVPIGPSGSAIALNATSSIPGRKIGKSSYLVRQGVYLANGNGTGFRLAWAADEGDEIDNLTASGDGRLLAWTTPWQSFVMNMASGRVHEVGGISGDNIGGLIAEPHRIVVFPGDGGGAPRLLRPNGQARSVHHRGAGSMPTGSPTFVSSPDGTAVAGCATVHRGGRPVGGIRLGVFDPATSVLRRSRIGAGLGGTLSNRDPSCAVSDDGSTVASIGTGRRRAFLLARRHGRSVRVPVSHPTVHVASLSPDGRYALIGGGPDDESQFGTDRMAELSGTVSVVDLDTGDVARVRSLNRYSRNSKSGGRFIYGDRAVWSPDEQRVALAPASGGVLILRTTDAAPTFIRTPPPPVGYGFDGKLADPVTFTPDGTRLVFTIGDRSDDVTVVHPFVVPADGSAKPTYLLSASMRSFSSTVASPDGTRTWVLPSYTCHSTYPQPVLALAGGALWDGPFVASPDPFA
jgi:hypothetical protein